MCHGCMLASCDDVHELHTQLYRASGGVGELPAEPRTEMTGRPICFTERRRAKYNARAEERRGRGNGGRLEACCHRGVGAQSSSTLDFRGSLQAGKQASRDREMGSGVLRETKYRCGGVKVPDAGREPNVKEGRSEVCPANGTQKVQDGKRLGGNLLNLCWL